MTTSKVTLPHVPLDAQHYELMQNYNDLLIRYDESIEGLRIIRDSVGAFAQRPIDARLLKAYDIASAIITKTKVS